MTWTPDVALFTRWLSGGGAEKVITNLARGLAAQGMKVDLIIMESRKDEAIAPFPPNVRLVNLDIQPNERRRWSLPTAFQSLRSLPMLVDYLKAYAPPVLLSATHFINETALLAKLLARSSTRVIVSEHTYLSHEVKLTEQVSSRVIPLTVRALYPLADGVVAVSQGVAEDLQQFMWPWRKPVQVIYNSVVTPEMAELSQQTVDHPWFQNKTAPIVVSGGRFVRQKDFPNLLRAFARLREQMPARLVLLGSGREGRNLRHLAADLGITDDFWMPGFVENPYPYLRQADVFALSSAWEGLPTVLIEALSLGTPVVSTDCPSGPAEILRNGEYGKLVPVNDPEALAAALQQALQQEPQLAPDWWIDQFTPTMAIRRYMHLLGVRSPAPVAPVPGMAKPMAASPAVAIAAPASVTPLVSVVIPAYKAADLIQDALASVAAQTYGNWEVVIVEDGTHDGTEQIAHTFAQAVGQQKVRYVRHTVNQGLSAARNTGIAKASGSYIALLDHDDCWEPHHLEKLVHALESSGADVAYAPAEMFDYSTKAPLGFHGPQPAEWEGFPHSLLNRNYIPASAVVMHRRVPAKVGPFDTTLRRVEDLDYWLRCTAEGCVFTYVPEITNGYRQRNPQAMTSNKAEILEWHARVLRKHVHLPHFPTGLRKRVLARYHLGVVRRSWRNQPSKAREFLYWSLRLAPLGSLEAVQWVLMEALGREGRYVQGWAKR